MNRKPYLIWHDGVCLGGGNACQPAADRPLPLRTQDKRRFHRRSASTVVFSPANAFAVCPSPRNKPDDLTRAVADKV